MRAESKLVYAMTSNSHETRVLLLLLVACGVVQKQAFLAFTLACSQLCVHTGRSLHVSATNTVQAKMWHTTESIPYVFTIICGSV